MSSRKLGEVLAKSGTNLLYSFDEKDLIPLPLENNNEKINKHEYMARFKELEYETIIGNLVKKENIKLSSSKVARLLKDKLMTLPIRLAPKVSVEHNEKANFTTIAREIDGILREIQQGLADSRR